MLILRNNYILALFIFCISFLIYLPSLNNPFVWDDVKLIENSNRHFHELSINIVIPNQTKHKLSRYYRPVLHFSMFIDNKKWKDNPFGFHLTNNILFSFSAVLLFLFSLLIFKQYNVKYDSLGAFLTALIFSVHPMHVESISWVSGRTDVLCGLFFLTAAIFHLFTYKKIYFVFLSSLVFLLALFSKETAVVFPLVILLIDLIDINKHKRRILVILAYLLVLYLYFLLRSRTFINIPALNETLVLEGSNLQESTMLNLIELIKTFLSAYLIYLNKLFFPFKFNAYISNIPKDSAYLISSLIMVVIVSITFIYSLIKRKQILSTSIFWIFSTLGPSVLTAIFIIAATPIAERYLFIPSMGFSILVGYLLTILISEYGNKFLSISSVLLILIIFTFFTISRQDVWSSRASLWEDSSRKTYFEAFPYTNYGLALEEEGKYEEAKKQYLLALRPEINDSARGRAITANNLSILYIETEEYSKAEYWLNKAVSLDPYYGKTYYHLGLIYYIKANTTGTKKYYSTAEEYLREAIKIFNGYGKANLLLAKIYSELGLDDKALQEAIKARDSRLSEYLLKEAEEIIKIYDSATYQ